MALVTVGVGITASVVALEHDKGLSAALEAGVDAGGDLIAGVWAAVSGKILDRQASGQMKPVADHFNKLANPNEPGGNDPRNRNKWKQDIRNALDRAREKVEKMTGKQRERWDETLRRNEDRLRDAQ